MSDKKTERDGEICTSIRGERARERERGKYGWFGERE
jgi:hypothetical protein